MNISAGFCEVHRAGIGGRRGRNKDHSKGGFEVVSAIHLQRRNKRFLRDVDLAELPHLLLAVLLLLQKLALAREVGLPPVSMGLARVPQIIRAAMMASCR
jgi:hypothetical protein